MVATIARNLQTIKSLDTILNFSKSLLLLLMDDEHIIRERNANVVTSLVGGVQVIPSYAQELFITFLMEKLKNFDKYEIMSLIALIVIDGNEGENNLDDNIAEYRVFDKNEVNIFSETVVVKRQCMSLLQQKFLEAPSIDEEMAKVVEANRKFANAGSEAEMRKFLRTCADENAFPLRAM